jgi:hypothetical protein
MAAEKKSYVKPTLTILGILTTMASIWWFALRPRRRGGEA